VTDARRALLTRLIDHAALFPPASMDMPEAMEADREARASEHAWMLGRFICPASRLNQLPDDAPPLSVVLDDGLETVVASGRRVELVEGREPVDVTGLGVQAFWEVPIDRIGEVSAAGDDAKIRCGGVTAEAFPPVEHVAAFVAACRDAGVRFKATAGLHHPIRHVEEATGFHMHGFLNLLAAAVFAHTDGLDEGELAEILAEEDPEAFTVDADGIAVHGRRADAAAIAAAREELFFGYGSCSFTEPVNDLLELGILPASAR
jgi:hypothetical protein